MAERRITHSRKDDDGDILGVKGVWGTASTADVVSHIENSTHVYYVRETDTSTRVHVVTEGRKKHIRTNADSRSKNNLDNLPDF